MSKTAADRQPRARATSGHSPALSVIIPTFNEAENIEELLRRLDEALPATRPAEVIFVDDSSDDTASVITENAARIALPVTLIRREKPTGGLGGAVVEGLRAARAPWAVVMDGDLQHPPSMVPTLHEAGMRSGSDVVVATRYREGGSSDGLGSAYRRHVSSASKRLAAAVLGGPIGNMSDPLSGFFAVRTDALRLDAVNPIGYKVLLELIMRSGLTRIDEVPYRFGARHAGTSKSTLREGMRYLQHLLVLRAAQLREGRQAPATRRAHLELVGSRTEDAAHPQLKILLVTSEAPPIVSGISRTVDRIATGLRERGHTVDVLSSVQIPRLVLGEYRFSALAAYWPAISRRLAGYDVVNLHGPVPTMSDVFLALGARRRAPIVYMHHCPLAIRGVERLCAVYNRIHRVLSGRADLTLATSEYYAEQERRPGGPEVRVVAHGVDVRPRPLKARAGEGPLRVLFVGQMRGYKGVDRLIGAVAGRSEIELTLIGDGPERAEYEQLAADLGGGNVRFLGRVPDEVLHAEYDRNDVVVLPSVTKAEAYGLVTLEGMAAACVPVVSDLPGVRDLAQDVGLVVPPGDEAALREALLGLATDHARRKELSGLARRKAEGLSWDNCVGQYERALLDAATSRAARPVRSLRPVRYVAAAAAMLSMLPRAVRAGGAR
ncbi:glycosyltransferase [Pseudonocardia zijingensis]|uniref:Glycosyltransferase involved in cell wall biosynthesis n=1 Tax=Pseudonocardia zijingensis TaxID=153376 RepID=A0ABN1P0G8_9PSEU